MNSDWKRFFPPYKTNLELSILPYIRNPSP